MLVEEFKQWLIEEGKAPKTITSYVTDIRKFEVYRLEHMSETSEVLSRFLLMRYKQYLQSKEYKITTINKKLNSLKVYNDFLNRKNIVSEIFIQLKKDQIQIAHGSEKEVTVMTEEQIEKFLFYIEDKNKVNQRNRLIGYLLLYTGIRVNELVNIRTEDICLLTGILKVKGKGGKIREVSLRADVVEHIKLYLKDRVNSPFTESPYLLLSQRRGFMHQDAVRNWLKVLSKALEFHLHPHLFRHTFATRLIEKGVNIVTVSKLAGHANVNTTIKYYIHTSKEEKQSAVERL